MDWESEESRHKLQSEVTFPLLSLPDVVLRQLISGGYLDPESTFFMGVTCYALNAMVSKQISSRGSKYWQSLLDGVDTFTKDLVQAATILINWGAKADQDRRRLHLIHQITKRFPKNLESSYVAVKCAQCKSEAKKRLMQALLDGRSGGGGGVHQLSWPGFLLLVEASKGSDPPPLPIRKADLGTGFLRIAAYAARQAEPIESLSISEIHCGSSSEGEACVSLLQQSLKWDVDILRLTGSVGELFWEGLATAMAGCKSLEKIRLSRRVMARGRPDHLRRVWQSTSHVWCVYGGDEICRTTFGSNRVDKEEEGWKEIERIIDNA